MIQPTKITLTGASLLWLSLVTIEAMDLFNIFSGVLLLFILALAFWDMLFILQRPRLSFKRDLPQICPCGLACKVSIRLSHSHGQPQVYTLYDHVPNHQLVDVFPKRIVCRAKGETSFHYQVLPLARGRYFWKQCDIKWHSRWGLWTKLLTFEEESEQKVYPNYAQAFQYGVLASARKLGHGHSHSSPTGIWV